VNKQHQILYEQKTQTSSNEFCLKLILHENHFYSARNHFMKADEIDSSCFIYESVCDINEQFAFVFHSAGEFVEALGRCSSSF
jgi:hypothetical protein